MPEKRWWNSSDLIAARWDIQSAIRCAKSVSAGQNCTRHFDAEYNSGNRLDQFAAARQIEVTSSSSPGRLSHPAE